MHCIFTNCIKTNYLWSISSSSCATSLGKLNCNGSRLCIHSTRSHPSFILSDCFLFFFFIKSGFQFTILPLVIFTLSGYFYFSLFLFICNPGSIFLECDSYKITNVLNCASCVHFMILKFI